MTIVPLAPLSPLAPAFEPDVATGATQGGGDAFGTALRSALGEAGSAFARADAAESAFVSGRGGLQEMVVERAQADVILALATSTATRTAQSLSAVFNLQI